MHLQGFRVPWKLQACERGQKQICGVTARRTFAMGEVGTVGVSVANQVGVRRTAHSGIGAYSSGSMLRRVVQLAQRLPQSAVLSETGAVSALPDATSSDEIRSMTANRGQTGTLCSGC